MDKGWCCWCWWRWRWKGCPRKRGKEQMVWCLFFQWSVVKFKVEGRLTTPACETGLLALDTRAPIRTCAVSTLTLLDSPDSQQRWSTTLCTTPRQQFTLNLSVWQCDFLWSLVLLLEYLCSLQCACIANPTCRLPPLPRRAWIVVCCFPNRSNPESLLVSLEVKAQKVGRYD